MNHLERVPMPGDAVVLTCDFGEIPKGSVGVLEGTVGQPLKTYIAVFGGTYFRGFQEHPELGAPFVIGFGEFSPYVHVGELVATDSTWKICFHEQMQTMFLGGRKNEIEVPLWKWRGHTGNATALRSEGVPGSSDKEEQQHG